MGGESVLLQCLSGLVQVGHRLDVVESRVIKNNDYLLVLCFAKVILGCLGVFPECDRAMARPCGIHGYKTNNPMNPEGTGHHHGLYHGIDR